MVRRSLQVVLLVAIAAFAFADDFHLRLPQSECNNGTATVAVTPVTGASYSWSVDGATIVSGQGTDHVTLRFGNATTAKITVIASISVLNATANGEIPLRDPLAVSMLDASATATLSPVTLTWQFANDADPAQQTLNGNDFPQGITLPRGARRYTYTPAVAGPKDVMLRASDGVGTPAPPPSRRRGAASADVGASDCSMANALTHYSVSGCSGNDIAITAPETVQPGASFFAAVFVDASSTVEWTITNATPATASGANVNVIAAQSGEVGIDAKVTNAAGCVTATHKAVRIGPPVECDHPTAVVSNNGVTCGGGIARVVFTGSLPFKGRWSDGEAFESNSRIMERVLTKAGTFTIQSFTDAYCVGTASGSAVGGDATSTVSIELKGPGSCGSNIIAKFKGTPPFTGFWYDTGEWFTTSATQIEHTIVGQSTLVEEFHDALCTDMSKWSHSNTINVKPVPTGIVRTEGATCVNNWSPGVSMAVDIDGYPPFNVVWSDGYVQKDVMVWPVRRFDNLTKSTTYTVVSVMAGDCPVTMKNDSVHFDFSPRPWIQPQDYPLCARETATATLYDPPPATATVTWSVAGGTIVSGQGTRTLTWQTGENGVTPQLSCTLSYPDSCPMSDTFTMTGVRHLPNVLSVQTPLPAFKSGKNTTFKITGGNDGNHYAWFDGAKGTDMIVMTDVDWDTHTYTFEYRSVSGPGPVTLALVYTDWCEVQRKVPNYLSFNIEP